MKTVDAEIRSMLIEVSVAEAHSHLLRRNWMVLLLDKLALEDVFERLQVSYNTVIMGLPKRVRVSLG
ncbi:MAG: hypothetical protein ABJO36_01240 [Litorimonas sp.]